ncbi:MAG: DNA primase [Candidatus Sumerlaeota bacterium]|nr:DNA primase [Candidatus Sumerlaeota bacterium]
MASDDYKEFIAKVRDTADIVQVVESYNIDLKRAGQNMKGCCPFHNEKTPSFHVHPVRQIFKCYGCNEGGDVIAFVQKIENLDFREAIESLARRYQIPIPQFRSGGPSPEEGRQRESQYQALELAAVFFAKHLMTQGHDAIAYVQKRGVDKPTFERFRLGMAPGNWSGLMDELRRKQYKDETLLQAGLIQARSSGDGYRDRFVNRLMFPICDPQGRVVGFGGRTMTAGEEPKYLNSPETPLYQKHKILYAFHLARKRIGERRECFLVEGYFDAIAMHQFGFANTVASCGTALTDDQARLIRRLCDSVIFLYDADAAGKKAMARGCEILMAHDFSIRIATLTEGDDPDTFLQKNGAKGFEEFIASRARDFLTFLVDFHRAQQNDDSVHGRSRVLRTLAPMIAKVPNALARNDYARRAALQLGLPENDVFAFLNEEAEKQKKKGAAPSPTERTEEARGAVPSAATRRTLGDPYEAIERHALWFVLHKPEARVSAGAYFRPEYFINADIRHLMERAIEAAGRAFQHPSEIMELAETESQRAVLAEVSVAAREQEAGYDYESLDAAATVQTLLERLHRVYLKRCADRARADLARAEEKKDEEAMRELRDSHHDHTKHRVELYNKEYKPLLPPKEEME